MTPSHIIIIVLLALLIFMVFTHFKQRGRLERLYHKFKFKGMQGRRWPIKSVPLDQVSPVFQTGEFGTLAKGEVKVLAGRPAAGVSALESAVLAALASESKGIFEFGTCTGATTYLLALNSPDDARVTTLTLAPDQVEDARFKEADIEKDADKAREESCYSRFLYSDTGVEGKVEQLFTDSKDLDENAYAQKMDLIFIDGAHTYSYVKNDTEKSLTMIRPGGLIVWHDYRGPYETAGVYQALNEYAGRMDLHHIQDTNLVCYRHV